LSKGLNQTAIITVAFFKLAVKGDLPFPLRTEGLKRLLPSSAIAFQKFLLKTLALIPIIPYNG
jgi:hypothetical protein